MPGSSVSDVAKNSFARTCFYVVAMLGSDVPPSAVSDFLLADGADIGPNDVRWTMNRMSRARSPLIEAAVRGRDRGRGRGYQNYYRLTEHGRLLLARE